MITRPPNGQIQPTPKAVGCDAELDPIAQPKELTVKDLQEAEPLKNQTASTKRGKGQAAATIALAC